MKKGFTLIEILFALAIIGLLAGFAITKLKPATDKALLESMKNDAKNAILVQQILYSDIQAFDDAEGFAYFDSASGKGNDKGILYGQNGTEFYLSKDNYLFTESYLCQDGSMGFEVQLQNDNANEFIYFDSCDNSAIQVLE